MLWTEDILEPYFSSYDDNGYDYSDTYVVFQNPITGKEESVMLDKHGLDYPDRATFAKFYSGPIYGEEKLKLAIEAKSLG